MTTKSPLFRIDRLLIAALALLAAPQVQAQTTFTWTNQGASSTYLTAANWQTNGVTSTTAATNSTSIARFTNSTNLSTIGANLNTLGGTLNLGSLLKEGAGNTAINNSSTTVAGQMRIFGTVSGSETNLIVSLGTGALTLTNGTSAGLMDIQLATGGIINVSNSGGRVVLASLIKEDAGETNTITKTGAGTLVISGTNVNTWGGGLVLNAGVLQLNKSSALGAESGLGLTINGGSLDNGSGAAVTLSNYAQTWGGNFTFIGTTNLNLGAGSVNLTGTRTVTVTANALTVGGAITNTGGITKAGAGTLILNGANTYSGTTTVNAGTLALGNVNALQNSVLDTGTSGSQVVTFNVGGNNTYNIGGLQGGDALAIGGNTLSVGSAGGNTTYSGVISGAGGALIKTGLGTMTLSGNNSYTGGTTVSSGGLVYNGTNTSTSVTVNIGATLGGGGSVGEVTVNGTVDPGNSPGTLSATALTLNGGGSYRWELTDAAGIAGTGWDVINVGSGSGVITLGATSGNQFTINVIGASPSNFIASSSYSWDVIDAGSWVTAFDPGAFLVNTNGFSAVGTLGTWSVANNSGNLQLVYTAPATATYAWNTGSGLWSSTGSWQGGQAPTNDSTIAFIGSGGVSDNDQVSSVASLTFSNGAGSYTISGNALAIGAGGIVNNSANSQTLSNNLSLSTPATINAASNNIVIAGNLTNGGNAVTINGAANTTISGAISGGGSLTKSGAGTATLSGLNSYAGGTTVSAGTLLGSTDSLQGNITNQSFLEFNQSADGTYGGIISGGGIVTKSGSGNVTFSGANSYNGGTIIAGGTLTGTTATVPGDIDVSAGATFALNQTTDGTFSGLIEGAGRLVKDGSGNVTLGGSNTYSGGTLVSQGTLTGTASSLQGTITNNAAVVFNQASAGTYSGAMSGGGSLTKSGAGSLTLSGNNSYSGGTLVSQGALVGDSASLQGPITNNAAVVFNQASAGTYSGAMSGSGTMTKSGVGILTLDGNSSGYSGAVSVQGGGLFAANDSALGSSAVTLTNGSIQAANGVSLANNFTIGVAGSVTTNTFVSANVVAWDFNGLSSYGSSPQSPTTNASGVSIVGLTRGSGLTTSGTAAGSAWGASGWSLSNNATAAIVDNDFATFSITVSNGFALNLTNFGAYNVRRTAAGPTNGIWQWSTNGTDFTDVGSAITWGSTTTAAGNAQSAISLTNINSLQGVAAGTTVTFRAVNWNASTSAGTWYLNDPSQTSALDFLVNGQIATVSSNAAGGSGTLGIGEAGTATFSGNILNNSAATLTAAANGQATFSGAISGAGSVSKTGAGTVVLSGANTYSGGTVVNAGTLQIGDGGANGSLGSGDINITNSSSLVVNHSGTLNVNQVISGDGSVTKRGTGALIVGGVNTYTGLTSVKEGRFSVSLSASVSSDVTVESNAEIGGRGTITGNLTLESGAKFVLDLTGPLTVAGAVSLDNTFSINSLIGANGLAPDWANIANGAYTLISSSSNFDNINNFGELNKASIGGDRYAYFSNGSLSLNVVPEPSTYALLGLAAAGLGAHLVRRRRR